MNTPFVELVLREGAACLYSTPRLQLTPSINTVRSERGKTRPCMKTPANLARCFGRERDLRQHRRPTRMASERSFLASMIFRGASGPHPGLGRVKSDPLQTRVPRQQYTPHSGWTDARVVNGRGRLRPIPTSTPSAPPVGSELASQFMISPWVSPQRHASRGTRGQVKHDHRSQPNEDDRASLTGQRFELWGSPRRRLT